MAAKSNVVSTLAALSLMWLASAQHSYADRDWSQEDWAIACEGKSEGASCEFVTNETTMCREMTSELKWCWIGDQIGAKRTSTCSFSTSRNIMGCFTDPNTYAAYMACAGRAAGSDCMTTWRSTNHTGKCYNHETHGGFMCLEGPVGPDDECEGKVAGDQCDEDVGSYNRVPSPQAVCQHGTSSGRIMCRATDSMWEAQFLPCIGKAAGASCGYFDNVTWSMGVCTLDGNLTCREEVMAGSASSLRTLGSAGAIIAAWLAMRV